MTDRASQPSAPNAVAADRLIACMLGGTAPGARTELHDVALAVGTTLEGVYEQLLDAWFGEPRGLHVDAWCVLDRVAGYRVTLSHALPTNGLHLYFVNLGGYRPGAFGESHASWFFGAADKATAKRRAKSVLLPHHDVVHKDHLYAVDECLHVARVAGWHVHLDADPAALDPPVTSGYLPLPARTIDAWIAARAESRRNMALSGQPK
ncbi:MAG TPA: DUF1543 domain-containing protein [Rhodanobacteraceae bacterium]